MRERVFVYSAQVESEMLSSKHKYILLCAALEEQVFLQFPAAARAAGERRVRARCFLFVDCLIMSVPPSAIRLLQCVPAGCAAFYSPNYDIIVVNDFSFGQLAQLENQMTVYFSKLLCKFSHTQLCAPALHFLAIKSSTVITIRIC